MANPQFSVVIPAFNEASTIAGVVRDIEASFSDKSSYEIIVVDDGSTDGTDKQTPSHVQLVRHEQNQGHGAAIKSALKHSKSPIVVVCDADGQHKPKDIIRLLESLNKGNDLVVGARKDLWSSHHGLGNTGLNILASLVAWKEIPDLTSGLRALKKDKAMTLFKFYPDRFCFELITTIGFILKGFNVDFVRVEALGRRAGQSKIRALSDGLKFCFYMLRLLVFLKPLRFMFYLLIIALGGFLIKLYLL